MAGAQLGVVPQDAFGEYAALLALAGGPLCPAPAPLAAFAHVGLNRRLTWGWMEHEGEKTDQVVPAADRAAGTQVAIVRLGWKAKGEVGPKHVSAEVMAGIGDAPATRYTLQADTMVVAAFDAVRVVPGRVRHGRRPAGRGTAGERGGDARGVTLLVHPPATAVLRLRRLPGPVCHLDPAGPRVRRGGPPPVRVYRPGGQDGAAEERL